jgi:hypothetical protein
MQSNIEMVDKVNCELRQARAVATLLGAASLDGFSEELLGDVATVMETHINAAHEAVRQWAEGHPAQ